MQKATETLTILVEQISSAEEKDLHLPEKILPEPFNDAMRYKKEVPGRLTLTDDEGNVLKTEKCSADYCCLNMSKLCQVTRYSPTGCQRMATAFNNESTSIAGNMAFGNIPGTLLGAMAVGVQEIVTAKVATHSALMDESKNACIVTRSDNGEVIPNTQNTTLELYASAYKNTVAKGFILREPGSPNSDPLNHMSNPGGG